MDVTVSPLHDGLQDRGASNDSDGAVSPPKHRSVNKPRQNKTGNKSYYYIRAWDS